MIINRYEVYESDCGYDIIDPNSGILLYTTILLSSAITWCNKHPIDEKETNNIDE